MEIRGFLQCRKRLSWDNPSEEVDLTLRLGLPNHHERSQANQEAPPGITPQNFSHMNMFRYYNQAMENVGILPNAQEEESVRFGDIINRRPWSLRTWMQSNNGNRSGSLCQGEQRCTICGKTETPLWRRGPEGPRTLCNGCGLRYSRALKKN